MAASPCSQEFIVLFDGNAERLRWRHEERKDYPTDLRDNSDTTGLSYQPESGGTPLLLHENRQEDVGCDGDREADAEDGFAGEVLARGT
jgi:hypothetical protein